MVWAARQKLARRAGQLIANVYNFGLPERAGGRVTSCSLACQPLAEAITASRACRGLAT